MEKKIEPGVYTGLSFDEYLKLPALNKSNLTWMRYSPLHFYANCEDPNRVSTRVETEPMKMGTAIHTAILEPKTFKSRYVMQPEDSPKKPTSSQLTAKKPSDETVAAIAWWEKFYAENKDKELITADTWERCREIRKNVLTNPTAKTLLEHGKAEVTIVWEDPVEQLLCKARVDWLAMRADGSPLCAVDFKSTDSARASDFAKKVLNYSWHVQAAFYSDGITAAIGTTIPFVFAAIEKDAPFASQYFEAKDRTLEIGRALYRADMARVAACRKTGVWPGYSNEITELKLPSWAEKELENGPAATDY